MPTSQTIEIPFYIAAFLISLTCMVYTLIQNRQDKLQNKVYLGMLLCLLLNTTTETLCAFLDPYRLDSAAVRFVMELCQYLYFIFHTAMLPMLGYYVISVTGIFRRFDRTKHLLFLLPALLTELLMLTNPLNHWSYYYDENMIFTRNWGETFLYASSVLYFAFVMVNLFRSWKAITAKRRAALSYFFLMVVGGILVQLVNINLRVELFGESLAYLGVLLSVENEDDLLDPETGIYNRRALRMDLDNLLVNRQSFHTVCVKVENADIIRRLTGSAGTGALTVLLLDEFLRHIPRYLIYQTAPDTFVMTLMGRDRAQAQAFAQQISERFDRPWSHHHGELMLTATTILAEIPTDIDNTEDVFNMADSSLPGDHARRLFSREDLGYLLRRREVESAVQRGLDQGGFEVYYQPTYYADGKRIHGAEALVRLHDDKLGRLFPDEFIPVAERIGLIGEIDDYVLRSVCAFLAGGLPAQLGLECINVNLSVLQCLQPGFVDHILSIVEAGGADRSQINFEITESVDAADYRVLSAVVHEFRRAGFQISIDDYGTGYSNMQALFAMEFDVVKIDKSILWEAQKSSLGRIILENSVRMIRQMDRKILVEGVETAEQIELLAQLGVDYLQGFYFSRPVPLDELLKLLKN